MAVHFHFWPKFLWVTRNGRATFQACRRACRGAEVENGMLVGLAPAQAAFATGSWTTSRAGLRIATVATSIAPSAPRRLRAHVLDFDGLDRVDLCIDGRDEVDGALAVKGRRRDAA